MSSSHPSGFLVSALIGISCLGFAMTRDSIEVLGASEAANVEGMSFRPGDDDPPGVPPTVNNLWDECLTVPGECKPAINAQCTAYAAVCHYCDLSPTKLACDGFAVVCEEYTMPSTATPGIACGREKNGFCDPFGQCLPAGASVGTCPKIYDECIP